MNLQIRKLIAKAAYNGQASHIGSALSIVEILDALYFRVANIHRGNVHDPGRDRVILSKGHGSLALYAVLAVKGIIPMEYLNAYMVDGGQLPCHIDMASAPGLEASTGSLGHGPGLAEGIALANRLQKITAKIFVIIGDGELQEGAVWEAFNSIAFYKLNEIAIILDNNRFQGSDPTASVANIHNYEDIFAALGFSVSRVDGHNVEELAKALDRPSPMPKIVIADTIKGKGFACMEDTLHSHYMKINAGQYAAILRDLED